MCCIPLQPGDSVAFPAGTGICHTFLNNTADPVRLLVVGEKPKPENRIRYPLNPEHEATAVGSLDEPAGAGVRSARRDGLCRLVERSVAI